MNWNFQEILTKDPSSAWGYDTSGNIPPCGVAVRRTCSCTESHRVKNANLRHPSAMCMRPLQDCPWHSRTQRTDFKTHTNITVCSRVSIFLHSILNFRGCLTIHITFKYASYMLLPGDIIVTVDGCRLLAGLISVAAKQCTSSNISVSYGRTESQQDLQHIQCNINP